MYLLLDKTILLVYCEKNVYQVQKDMDFIIIPTSMKEQLMLTAQLQIEQPNHITYAHTFIYTKKCLYSVGIQR